MAQHDGVPGRETHRKEVLLRDRERSDQLGRERPDDGAIGSRDLLHELRSVQLAPIHERRIGVDELERRDDVIALPDPCLVDLARVHRLAERIDLPLVRRDGPRGLAREVDPGRLAEPELVRPVGEPVGSEHPGDLVEVRVR